MKDMKSYRYQWLETKPQEVLAEYLEQVKAMGVFDMGGLNTRKVVIYHKIDRN